MNKNKLLMVIFCLIISMNVMGQATSLTIDNQTPGWLSSKINYGDQLSVERLKVTGYINGTDYVFLSKLVEHNLKALDLEDVNIVEGGDPIYSYTTSMGEVRNTYIKANTFGQRFLTLKFNDLQWLATPKSAELSSDFYSIYVDTLFLNCTNQEIGSDKSGEKFYIYDMDKNKKYTKKYFVIGEGIKSINFSHINYKSSSYYHNVYTNGTIILPSSIEYIKGLVMSGGTLISYIQNPGDVKCEKEKYPNNSSSIDNCKLMPTVLWVPKGTKQSYMESEYFKNAVNIFEMAPPEMVEIEGQNNKLYKGESTLLQVSFTPENAFYKELTWETSDVNVATVSQSGEVTGANPGTAEITVRSAKDSEVYAKCTITVYEHATGISMSLTEKTINIGETTALGANTLPEGTTDNEIEWSSNDPTIATVDDMGNVTALKIGTCSIKATSIDGGYTAECIITVAQPATALTLNKHETSIIVNNRETLTAVITPDNTTNKTVVWASNKTDVAEVDGKGNVTAKKAGKALITATAASNGEANDVCEVTVIQPVTGITISETTLAMVELGEMKQLTATVLPEDASNKTVKWSSSNTSVCSVTENGTVVAVGYGTATIVATSEDGGFPAACVVNVAQPVTVTAKSYTKTYGEKNPTFEYETEGGLLDGEPEITCEADETSPVGIYPIVIAKGTISNVSNTFVNGTLTIDKAPLTVEVNDYTRAYGEENPEFELKYKGFVNNEDESVLLVKPQATTDADEESDAGEYDINIANGVAENYAFKYVGGKLTVEKAYQTLTWKQELGKVEQYEQIELLATASSGLDVTYTIEGAPVCSIVKIGKKQYLDCFGEGKAVVVAIQEGNQNYWQTPKIYKTIEIGNTTGIDRLIADGGDDVEIYDLNGNRVKGLRRGVNIVKTSDGKTRKVVVK